MKVCSLCKKSKSLDEFYKEKASKDVKQGFIKMDKFGLITFTPTNSIPFIKPNGLECPSNRKCVRKHIFNYYLTYRISSM